MARTPRSHDDGPTTLEDALAPLFGLMGLAIFGYVFTHLRQVLIWEFSILGVLIIAAAVSYFLYLKRKRSSALEIG